MIRSMLALAVLVAAFFISGAAQAQYAVTGTIIFNVPGEPCTAGVKTQTWTAPSLVRITAVQIWNGLDDGSAADVVENITRKSDGAMLINGNHDDYLNGGPVRTQKQDFQPNYFLVNAGDGLVFQYSCTWGQHGAWLVNVWYW